MGQHADSVSEICSSSTVNAEQCMNWVSFVRQNFGEMQALLEVSWCISLSNADNQWHKNVS